MSVSQRIKRALRRSWYFLVRLQREMAYDDAMGMAAQIAFYMMLGLFPFLIFLMSLLSYLPLGDALQPLLLDALAEQMPAESAAEVTEIVLGLLPARNDPLLSFGFLASLWGASMSVGALITTINRAYNIRPRRSIFAQKALSIVLVLALSGIWLTALFIVLVGPSLTAKAFEFIGLAAQSSQFWASLRLPLAFVLILFAVAVLYYYAPEARQEFRWILPGTVTATILWLGASSLFRIFLRNFGQYNKTYGSLAAVVILMVWLWITGVIFLLGAEINALMKRKDYDINRRHRPLS
jgi:membrane protein